MINNVLLSFWETICKVWEVDNALRQFVQGSNQCLQETNTHWTFQARKTSDQTVILLF